MHDTYGRIPIFGLLFLSALAGLWSAPAHANQVFSLEVLEVLEQPEFPSDSGTARVRFKILDGQQAGDTFVYRHHLWGHSGYDPDFYPGAVFVGSLSSSENSIDRLRLGQPRKHYILIGLFLLVTLLLVVIAGWEGLAGLLCSTVTFCLIFWFFFPVALTGTEIIGTGFLLCFLTIAISIPLILRVSRPTLPAVVSLTTVTGVLFLLTRWGMDYLQLSPEKVRHSRIILTELNRMTVDTGEAFANLLITGIVIGTLGAMMDVAVVISSTIHEITRDAETVILSETFQSGMNVGREILSTMINTLIFAYLGILLPFILTLEVFDLSGFRLLNYSFVGAEILRVAIGLIGLSLIIPVTAFISAWWSQ